VAAIAAIAVFGWWLRVAPLLRAGGSFAYPIDYDEGVYFSTAALFARGSLPYRDFLYVHPPGLPILLSPLAGPIADVVGVGSAFAAARVVATVIGVANIVLVGLLGRRLRGNVAGLVAAALYATYPAAVAVERGPFLEPILNLLVLAGALAWLRPRPVAKAWDVAAGFALGVACAVKTWGAFAVAAVLASATRHDRQRVVRLLAGVAIGAGVLIVPVAALAPGRFIDDVLRFQLSRPPDGVGRADRVRLFFELFWVRGWHGLGATTHVVSSTAALVGLVAAAVRKERFLLALYGLMLATFLLTPAYFTQYQAHLAVPEVLLAGYGVATVFDRLARVPVARVALVAAVVVALALPVHSVVVTGRQHGLYIHRLAQVVERIVPPGDCVYAFDPAWTLAADRLPPGPADHGVPLVPDPYGTMLWDSVRRGDRQVDAAGAFESPASQTTIRQILERCDWLVLGGRGQGQLAPENDAYVEANFERQYPPEGERGLDLWRRKQSRGVGTEG
jgi:4-amino-4-deoxy-L-arabinose transferase-like glycosyltransferase